MYHIKNDKRAMKSADLICGGLADILKKKTYPEISISEVCAQNGVARTTFYRLFDTLDDVLTYQFDKLFENSLNRFSSEQRKEVTFAKIMIETAVSDKALITAIVSGGRSDLFNFVTRQKENAILSGIGLFMTETDRKYCTAMLTQLAYSVISVWIATGCRESAEELYAIMRHELKTIYENM
ncbi:MAG: hypothetical protein ACI4JY_07710 [Oscillospiraceae bacterium]